MEELDLKEVLNIFWKGKFKIIGVLLVFIVLGIVYTMNFVTPVYTASTRLVLATSTNKNKQVGDAANSQVSSDQITSTEVSLNANLVETYSELVKSKNVMREVIKNLNLQNEVQEENLRNSVSVTAVKNTAIIEIAVTNADPKIASDIANEIAKVFTAKVKEIYNIDNVHVVDEAEIPNEPSNINHIKDVIKFVAVGLVIAIMYVLVANMLDTTVKSAEEIEQALKLLVLVSIPVCNIDNDRKGR